MKPILFGTAGLSESFRLMGYHDSLDAVEYTKQFGLNAFEYQCGHGVRLSLSKAEIMKQQASEMGISLSVHAPYYISLASKDDEKRFNSVEYFLQSCRLVKALGGSRVVFHPGTCSGMSRGEALERASETLMVVMKKLDEQGFSDCVLCPETMGKQAQLGDLDEVLALCRIDKRFMPCIDFGHINARTSGGVHSKEDYRQIITKMVAALGRNRVEEFHSHFSKIEYTSKGEKRHLTFEDQVWGPDWQPLLDVICEEKLRPTIICESAGTQAEDAVQMMAYYKKISEMNG